MEDALNPIYQPNPSLSRDLGGLEETGSHHYLILENLEKDLCPLSMMNFIREQTSIIAHAWVIPSLSSETSVRGGVLVDSETKLGVLYDFIENPNHFIVSLSGRPWVIAETRTGICKVSYPHSFRPKYEMEPYATFQCPCGKGNVVRRISISPKDKNRVYFTCPDSKPELHDWGCNCFLWEDELQSCPCCQGLCIVHKYPSGVHYKCSINGEKNCDYEVIVPTKPGSSIINIPFIKKKILEAKLDLAMNPADYPSQSAAALHEQLNGLSVEDD